MHDIFLLFAFVFVFLSGRAWQAASLEKRHLASYDDGYYQGFLDGLDGYPEDEEPLRDRREISCFENKP
jgi:hypothetical protein